MFVCKCHGRRYLRTPVACRHVGISSLTGCLTDATVVVDTNTNLVRLCGDYRRKPPANDRPSLYIYRNERIQLHASVVGRELISLA